MTTSFLEAVAVGFDFSIQKLESITTFEIEKLNLSKILTTLELAPKNSYQSIPHIANLLLSILSFTL